MTTTLLAVDDSKTMRKVLEITFAGEDYRTLLAANSADALAQLREHHPAVALVDATLGSESGYDLCQQIKQSAPQTVVLILSSKQQPFDRGRGAGAGADDFMDKPFDTQQLLDKVAAAVRRGPIAKPPAGAPTIQQAPPTGAQPVPAGFRGATRPGAVGTPARAQTAPYGAAQRPAPVQSRGPAARPGAPPNRSGRRSR